MAVDIFELYAKCCKYGGEVLEQTVALLAHLDPTHHVDAQWNYFFYQDDEPAHYVASKIEGKWVLER